MCRTFFPLYGATVGYASAGGNPGGEGQKGTWKPSSETPLPPAESTLSLSLPFLLVSRCCLAPVPPTPGLLLGADYSEHSLPLKTSVNYKNPPLLKISGAEWIMEAVSQMEAKQDFSGRLDRGGQLVKGPLRFLPHSPPPSHRSFFKPVPLFLSLFAPLSSVSLSAKTQAWFVNSHCFKRGRGGEMGVGEGSDLCLSKKAQKLPSDTVLTNTFFSVAVGVLGMQRCLKREGCRRAAHDLARGGHLGYSQGQQGGGRWDRCSRLLFGLLSDSAAEPGRPCPQRPASTWLAVPPLFLDDLGESWSLPWGRFAKQSSKRRNTGSSFLPLSKDFK